MSNNLKVDVAVQSYKKPESLVYTLLSLKKRCGDIIDTVYINDDCSGNEIERFYDKKLKEAMYPIKIKFRINNKASGYTLTLLTKEMWKKKSVKEKVQLIMQMFINRVRFFKTSDDVRYQWAINSTDKKYIFLMHDDIKFFDNVVKLYTDVISSNENIAIVGDLGGNFRQCPYAPCDGTKCSPKKIIEGKYPCEKYPVMGYKTFFHKILGRAIRTCRINEWCCMLNVDVAEKLKDNYGIYFGNYEGGGDVGTYWFEKIIKLGYDFTDPLPTVLEREKYYKHPWQGHEGHQVWVSYDGKGKKKYDSDMIKKCLLEEFNYRW